MPYELLVINDVDVPLNNWKFKKSEVKFIEKNSVHFLWVGKHFPVI